MRPLKCEPGKSVRQGLGPAALGPRDPRDLEHTGKHTPAKVPPSCLAGLWFYKRGTHVSREFSEGLSVPSLAEFSWPKCWLVGSPRPSRGLVPTGMPGGEYPLTVLRIQRPLYSHALHNDFDQH